MAEESGPLDGLAKAADGLGKALGGLVGGNDAAGDVPAAARAAPNRRERRYSAKAGQQTSSKQAVAAAKRAAAVERKAQRKAGKAPVAAVRAPKAPPPVAAKQLLAECGLEERNLETVSRLVGVLEALPLPETRAGRLRAVVGDWRLAFADSDAAVAPFVTGAAPMSAGPLSLSVVEAVYHSWRKARNSPTSDYVTREVVRNFGVWGGNTLTELHGKWEEEERAGSLTWRPAYAIESGRECPPPESCARRQTATLTHASADVLVLRVGNAARSADASLAVAVFSRVLSLKEELGELGVGEEPGAA